MLDHYSVCRSSNYQVKLCTPPAVSVSSSFHSADAASSPRSSSVGTVPCYCYALSSADAPCVAAPCSPCHPHAWTSSPGSLWPGLSLPVGVIRLGDAPARWRGGSFGAYLRSLYVRGSCALLGSFAWWTSRGLGLGGTETGGLYVITAGQGDISWKAHH